MPGQPLHVVRQTVPPGPEESLDITENELIQALAEAQPVMGGDRDGFLTTKEMVSVLGWSLWAVGAQLRELHKQGRLEVRKVKIIDISGRCIRVPAYRLKA